MSRKLQNYLRTYRKRFGLSQKELAFLLGFKSGAQVSRSERFQQVPNLQTALAFQAVFGVPVAELFAGIYEQAEKETSKRARLLIRKMQGAAVDQAASRKAELLRAIAITPSINKENP
jgi:transcriptional regulator with XRE-family HTH domain